jgi:hypothetical protein
MAISKLLTIFDPTTSPGTGIADGDSKIIQVGPLPVNQAGGEVLYPITFAMTVGGTATLTPYMCSDPSASPRVWVAVDKDGVTVTRIADSVVIIDAPSQSLLKWAISAGSTPSVSMTARGFIRGSA